MTTVAGGMIRWLVPRGLAVTAVWLMAMVLLMRAAYNVTIPRFWDRFVFPPVFIGLAALSLLVAWPRGVVKQDSATPCRV